MIAAAMTAIVPPANAAFNVILLPPIPVLPAKIGETGAVVGRSLQGSVSIIDPELLPIDTPPFFLTQTAFDSYSFPFEDFAVNSQSQDLAERSDGRTVAVNKTSGFVSSKVVASPGKLRGQAIAGGGGGSVTGVATATAMFVDTLTLVHGGGYFINWNVHGSITGEYSTLTPDIRPRTRPGAGGSIRAQMWWVPYEVNLTQAAQSNFLGSYYESRTWVYNVETGGTVITNDIKEPDFGEEFAFDVYERDGTKFWVVGLLEVTAGRGAGDSGTVYPSSLAVGKADFMNTIELTIDSYNFPGTSDVISASGHDYSKPPPPLSITGCSHTLGTGMEISYSASPQASVTLQRSVDLLEWTALETAVVSDSGTGVAVDPNPPPGRAYYRLSSQ